MAFTPKNHSNPEDGFARPLAAALEDMELRLSDYTDTADTRWDQPGVSLTSLIKRHHSLISGAQNSGLLRVTALDGKLEAGQAYSGINLWSGTTASSELTHSWACLVDLDTGTVLASTADNTDEWLASTKRAFAFASDYEPTVDVENPGVGYCVTATTTMPTVVGVNGSSVLIALAPKLGGYEAGYSTPAAADTELTLTASSFLAYAEVE